MEYTLNISRVNKDTRWKGKHLKRGEYFGYDEYGNPCITKLKLSGNKLQLISMVNGSWSDRYIYMYSKCVPIYIQQILFVNKKRKDSAIIHYPWKVKSVQ